MRLDTLVERKPARAQPTCPICAKSSKRDYPSGSVCSLCGYEGAWPYAIPDTTEADARQASLLDRSRFAQERRRKSRLTTGPIPADWLPVRAPGMTDEVFTALFELGWLAYADPLDDVHLGQGELFR